MTRLLAFFSLLSFLIPCSCSSPKLPRATAREREMLDRMVERAARDSVRFARCGFDYPATMTLEMLQDDRKIAITDEFRLVKQPDSMAIQTVPGKHTVAGDTTLLKDMYTFRTSQGTSRISRQGQLAGMNFGADFPHTLRELQSDTVNSSFSIRDSVVSSAGGVSSLIITYITPERSGFFLTGSSGNLLTSQSTRRNDYVVGSYEYHIETTYRRAEEKARDSASGRGGDRLTTYTIPTTARAVFNYRRLFTKGTGTMSVKIGRK